MAIVSSVKIKRTPSQVAQYPGYLVTKLSKTQLQNLVRLFSVILLLSVMSTAIVISMSYEYIFFTELVLGSFMVLCLFFLRGVSSRSIQNQLSNKN